jgi:hypothetical protein
MTSTPKVIIDPLQNDHIMVIENAFTEKMCRDFIDYAQTHPDSLSRDKRMFNKTVVSSDKRATISEKDTNGFDQIRNHILYLIFEYYSPNYIPLLEDHELLELPELNIQRSDIFDGYYVFHSDSCVSRRITFIIYLNDVDDGGETEFIYQKKKIKPKQGRMVIFPACYTHTHRGNPVYSGVKYVLTGWLNANNKDEEV